MSTSAPTLSSRQTSYPSISSAPSPPRPSSSTSTQIPAKALPTKPPILLSPTTYPRIRTRRDFNSYVYFWLHNNMEGEHASDTEKESYHELLEKYG